jgi:hypothetical protein
LCKHKKNPYLAGGDDGWPGKPMRRAHGGRLFTRFEGWLRGRHFFAADAVAPGERARRAPPDGASDGRGLERRAARAGARCGTGGAFPTPAPPRVNRRRRNR